MFNQRLCFTNGFDTFLFYTLVNALSNCVHLRQYHLPFSFSYLYHKRCDFEILAVNRLLFQTSSVYLLLRKTRAHREPCIKSANKSHPDLWCMALTLHSVISKIQCVETMSTFKFPFVVPIVLSSVVTCLFNIWQYIKPQNHSQLGLLIMEQSTGQIITATPSRLY